MRQGTNIDKLRMLGELSLIKIWELELEILDQNKELERSKFLKETNSLLRDLWSSKRVGNEFANVKKKIIQLFKEIRGTPSIEENAPKKDEEKIDTSSFIYYKNLRELSLYKDRLKQVKKEIFRALFANAVKKKRLRLKKKFIKQNIKIVESRVSKKRFSYTKIIKWLMYYEEVLVYLFRTISDIILYSFVFLITLFCFLSFSEPQAVDKLLQIVFLGSILWTFVVLFWKARSFLWLSFGFWIFFLVSFALRVNF